MVKRLVDFFKDFSNQKRYAKWMGDYAKPYLWSIIGLLVLNTAITSIGIGTSVASKYVIDLATASKGIATGVVLMVVLTSASTFLGIFLSMYNTVINEKFSFSIRVKMFEGILKTTWPEISRYHSGDLITRLTSDIESVTSGITSVVPSIITLTLQFFMAFAVLFHYDSGLAVFALISGPVAAVASLYLGVKLKRLQEKVQESESNYRSFLHENMNNILVIKSFNHEAESAEKFTDLRRERFNWVYKRTRLTVLAGTIVSMAFSGGYLIAFAIGAYKISNNLITYGTMTLFLSMIGQIQAPLVSLGRTVPSLISVLASAGRVMEISELKKEQKREGKFCPQKVSVSLKNVCFTYGNEYILKDVSLNINAGDTVAVTGSTGAGKTTLIKLLMAFIYPTSGKVIFSDENGLEEAANADSRNYIAYIPQGNFLFSGSIADNLRIGKTNATDEELIKALKCACADDFVNALPKGINTVIGERGEGLSEGQGQRIAIARAFIRKSQLLILDEATSALDDKTEYRILESIKNMDYHPTCIIITHRKAAISICNRHIHVQGGNILEYKYT